MSKSETADTGKSDRPNTWQEELKEWVRFIAGAGSIYLGITTIFFMLFFVPSESMLPGLRVGDRFVVSKWAYGWSRESFPFGIGHVLPKGDPDKRLFARMPHRGDVVVFRNPRNGDTLVKRLIGLPGDTIETRGGRLFINGEMATRTLLGTTRYRDDYGQIETAQVYSEQLPGDKRHHRIYEFSDDYGFRDWSPDNSGPFLVPAKHFFFMGDNRDDSKDSRAPDGPGMVPFANLVGKGEFVLFSLAHCKKEPGLTCAPSTLWKRM